MVKIKTSPENNKKVTIADLNSNIVQLTKALTKNATALNAAGINNLKAAAVMSEGTSSSSSSSKNKSASWYSQAAKSAWQGSEIYKQRSNFGSTAIGGVTGINPAMVQAFGIDKAIGSILKSTVNGIKKKWAEAGFGTTNNKKVNSALEANKAAPITSRLDKIIKLMGLSKKSQAIEKEKEKGFFGKLLSFLGSIMGPLLKIAAIGTAAIAALRAIKWLANKFGFTDREAANVGAPVLKGTGAGLQSASKVNQRLLQNEKAYRDALREYVEDPYYKKLTPQERAKQRLRPSEKAPAEFIRKQQRLNIAEENLYKTKGASKGAITNAVTRGGAAGERLASGKITPKIVEPTKLGLRNTAYNIENLAGKGIDIAGTGLLVYSTGADVVQDIKDENYGKVAPDIAKGGAMYLGMKYGAKAGAHLPGWWKIPGAIVGAGAGAVAGKEGVEAIFPEYYANQLTLEELAHTHPEQVLHPYAYLSPEEAAARKKLDAEGKHQTAPKWRNNALGRGAKVTWDHAISKYLDPFYYYDWIKGNPTYMYGASSGDLDPVWRAYVYAQGKQGKKMPEIPSSAYMYDFNMPFITAGYEDIYNQGRDAYKKEINKKFQESLKTGDLPPLLRSLQTKTTLDTTSQTYGITTDFNAPIEASDAQDGVSSIANDTRTLTDYVKNISDGMDILRSGALQSNMSKFQGNNISFPGQTQEAAGVQEPASLGLFAPGGVSNVRTP